MISKLALKFKFAGGRKTQMTLNFAITIQLGLALISLAGQFPDLIHTLAENGKVLCEVLQALFHQAAVQFIVMLTPELHQHGQEVQ